MIIINYLDISSIESLSELNPFIRYLSQSSRNKIAKLKFTKEKIHTVLGEVLAKQMISKNCSIPVNDIYFGYNHYGKPFIEGFEHIFFNLSHSENFIICALSNKAIGIDIEYIREYEQSISELGFCESEYSYLLSLKPTLRASAFYTLWCLKESYLKNIGTGLYEPLNSICFKINENNITILHSAIDSSHLNFKILPIHPNYKVSVCFESNSPIKLSKTSVDYLNNFFHS